MDYILKTKNLTKTYGRMDSVKDLDLRVPQKSIYGFLGPNGAGKSTTMKMILNLVKPTGGAVEIFGKTMNQQNRLNILKHTGSLVESPSYYGHLSGRENLEIVQMLKGVPKEQIDEVLHIVRMENQQNKKADHYSLGMKQRLGIAMALLGRPKLLLLDEPTNGLDPSGIQEIRELICSLPERYGMTVVISSHLLSEIDQMADTVGIIDKGELVFQDSMERLQSFGSRSIFLHTLDDEAALALIRERKLQAKRDQDGIRLSKLPDEKVAMLVAQMVERDIGILRVEEWHKSLEDIFLELTGRRLSL
ncbi:MAG: ATP-binding cassette domain-containing protein [Hespellia sp.]|nr:ATP-binding cassette domain-containing protein [Hespellia sp.]